MKAAKSIFLYGLEQKWLDMDPSALRSTVNMVKNFRDIEPEIQGQAVIKGKGKERKTTQKSNWVPKTILMGQLLEEEHSVHPWVPQALLVCQLLARM